MPSWNMRCCLSKEKRLYWLEYFASMFLRITPRACREDVVDGVIAAAHKGREMLFLKPMRLAAALRTIIRTVAATVVATLQHFLKLFLRQIDNLCAPFERPASFGCFAKVGRMRSTVRSIIRQMLFWVVAPITYMSRQDSLTMVLVVASIIQRAFLCVLRISCLSCWFIGLRIAMLAGTAFRSVPVL
jgi:hypothetical protein